MAREVIAKNKKEKGIGNQKSFLYDKHHVFLDLEWFLAEKNIIKDSELDEDPKLRRTNVKKTMSSGTNYRVSARDSDDDDDDTEY